MNLPESFGKRFILPLIPEFLALDPKITLDIFLQDKRVGAPPSPDDLAHHNGILYRQLATGRVVSWRFKNQQNDLTVTPKDDLIVSNIETAVMAFLDGIGIATVGRWRTMEAIDSGQLVELLNVFQPDPLPV
jgi:DNA-binding transcriptional LysR family regulator